jgi:hypothetical protein
MRTRRDPKLSRTTTVLWVVAAALLLLISIQAALHA